MTYNNFLELIFSPIAYFVNWLQIVANNLLTNYFFITILGLIVCVSLFWLLIDSVLNYFYNKRDKLDDYNDKYNDYSIYQKIQQEYYNKHRLEIFAYKYDKYAMGQQIIFSFFERNKDFLLDYKIQNLKLNKLATYSYLINNNDIESAIDYHNFRLKKVVSYDYIKSYHDDEVKYRIDNAKLSLESKIAMEEITNNTNKLSKLRKQIKNDSNIVPPLPDWYDKAIEYQPLTPEEQEELNNLIDNF